jgi:hypothetical protein
METMRRLIHSLAALSFLAAVFGCNHTAGVCDCDLHHNPTAPLVGHIEPVAIAPVAATSTTQSVTPTTDQGK